MSNPLRDPDAHDYALLAGKKTPGLVSITGASAPRNWDIRNGYGLSGAHVVYTGDGLAKFTIRIFCWEEEHFDAYDADIHPLVRKGPRGVRPKALDVSHPYLADLGIASMVVEDLTQWEQIDAEPGMFFRDVKAIQFRAPLPTVGRPEAAASRDNSPKAEDEYDKTIAVLTKKVQELAG